MRSYILDKDIPAVKQYLNSRIGFQNMSVSKYNWLMKKAASELGYLKFR